MALISLNHTGSIHAYEPEKAAAPDIYYYQNDHLGTPQELTDHNGNIVWAVTMQSWGKIQRQLFSKVNNPLRFQGQYHDEETGLHYNRHRYYDPNTARFTTLDPIGLEGGLNNYQYVTNPTGWVDPLGLSQRNNDDLPCCTSDSHNWNGTPVETYQGHEWSPLDPPMSSPPIFDSGPFTDKQRNAMLKGKSGGTRIAPHHRHQLPVESHGGVIDDLREPGHPDGNNHTALVNGMNRHPGASYFRNVEGGDAQRSREIRAHFREKGIRLVPHPTEVGKWIDPGPS